MNLFRKPGPRFAAEAIAIILAAAIPGILHLVWWEIGACVVIVLLAAVWVESSMGTPAPAPRQAEEIVEPPPPVVQETHHVRVLHERPLSELVPEPEPVSPPAPEPEPEPQPEPEPEPEPVAVAVAAPPGRLSGPPYNIWELERALEASGSSNDEQTFLLHYLRDYAGSNGQLPAEFDDLVRESFPALV